MTNGIDINNPSRYKRCIKKQHEVWLCHPPLGTIVADKFTQFRALQAFQAQGLGNLLNQNKCFITVSQLKSIREQQPQVFSFIQGFVSQGYLSQTNKAHQFVICGTEGELYTISYEMLEKQYQVMMNDSWVNIQAFLSGVLNENRQIQPFNWRRIRAKQEYQSMTKACFVPKKYYFDNSLFSTTGSECNLQGVPHGKGDFILCNTLPNGEPDLSHRWVVNGLVFGHVYNNQGWLDCIDMSRGEVFITPPDIGVSDKTEFSFEKLAAMGLKMLSDFASYHAWNVSILCVKENEKSVTWRLTKQTFPTTDIQFKRGATSSQLRWVEAWDGVVHECECGGATERDVVQSIRECLCKNDYPTHFGYDVPTRVAAIFKQLGVFKTQEEANDFKQYVRVLDLNLEGAKERPNYSVKDYFKLCSEFIAIVRKCGWEFQASDFLQSEANYLEGLCWYVSIQPKGNTTNYMCYAIISYLSATVLINGTAKDFNLDISDDIRTFERETPVSEVERTLKELTIKFKKGASDRRDFWVSAIEEFEVQFFAYGLEDNEYHRKVFRDFKDVVNHIDNSKVNSFVNGVLTPVRVLLDNSCSFCAKCAEKGIKVKFTLDYEVAEDTTEGFSQLEAEYDLSYDYDGQSFKCVCKTKDNGWDIVLSDSIGMDLFDGSFFGFTVWGADLWLSHIYIVQYGRRHHGEGGKVFKDNVLNSIKIAICDNLGVVYNKAWFDKFDDVTKSYHELMNTTPNVDIETGEICHPANGVLSHSSIVDKYAWLVRELQSAGCEVTLVADDDMIAKEYFNAKSWNGICVRWKSAKMGKSGRAFLKGSYSRVTHDGLIRSFGEIVVQRYEEGKGYVFEAGIDCTSSLVSALSLWAGWDLDVNANEPVLVKIGNRCFDVKSNKVLASYCDLLRLMFGENKVTLLRRVSDIRGNTKILSEANYTELFEALDNVLLNAAFTHSDTHWVSLFRSAVSGTGLDYFSKLEVQEFCTNSMVYCRYKIMGTDIYDYVVISKTSFQCFSQEAPSCVSIVAKRRESGKHYHKLHYHALMLRLKAIPFLFQYKHLKLLYLKYNQIAFDSKLPTFVPVVLGNYSKSFFDDERYSFMGQQLGEKADLAVIELNGRYGRLQRVDSSNIKIDETFKSTLIHEMCHCYTLVKYGTSHENAGEDGGAYYHLDEKYKDQWFCHGKHFGEAVEMAAQKLKFSFDDIFGYGKPRVTDLHYDASSTMTTAEKLALDHNQSYRLVLNRSLNNLNEVSRSIFPVYMPEGYCAICRNCNKKYTFDDYNLPKTDFDLEMLGRLDRIGYLSTLKCDCGGSLSAKVDVSAMSPDEKKAYKEYQQDFIFSQRFKRSLTENFRKGIPRYNKYFQQFGCTAAVKSGTMPVTIIRLAYSETTADWYKIFIAGDGKGKLILSLYRDYNLEAKGYFIEKVTVTPEVDMTKLTNRIMTLIKNDFRNE